MPRLLALLLLPGMLLLAARPWHDDAASGEVYGVIRDERGPVAGAVVRYKGLEVATISDAQGRFRLPRQPGRLRITAAVEGYFIAGESAGRSPLVLQLKRLPATDCELYAWVDPTPDLHQSGNCGNCHRAIHAEWQQSRHSSSGRNPRFLKQYDELLKQHPLGADVCASCHAPTLRPGGFGEFDMRQAALQSPGLSGIHCDYCHKVQGPGTGEWGLTHGRFQLSLLRPEPGAGQLFFGPLDDVDRGEDAPSRFQRDSRLCAACHEGVVFGIPVYTTFSEWQASPAGKAGASCQSCHMTPTGTMRSMAHGSLRRDPATLGNHRFFEVNQVEMLKSCLKVEVVTSLHEDERHITVSVMAERVGHRVPTGFIDRNLVLFVEGYEDGRARTAYRGPTLPDYFTADEAGRSGRSYARVLADEDGNRPARFWKADLATLIDTRLTPGEADVSKFCFPPEIDRVRVRLLHRRLWNKDDEQVIVDRWIDVAK